MQVPHRLLVAGGDGHYAAASFPKEILLDQMPWLPAQNVPEFAAIPDQLTLRDSIYASDKATPRAEREECAEENPASCRSISSVAIEDNPLQELKVMRRQLSRLSQRIEELERDMFESKGQEMLRFAFTSTALGVILLMMAWRK
ncbi:unnamed protein product, partial [Mesorhabditis spiculigera]